MFAYFLYIILTKVPLIRCSNKDAYQLFCHSRNDWETKFERSWTSSWKKTRNTQPYNYICSESATATRVINEMESELATGEIIYSTRTRTNASKVSKGERAQRETRLSLRWLNFQRQPKDRFCGIIFNEPWSHFRERKRETLSEFGQWWMQFRARVSTCFYQQDRAAGLFAGWCIIMDSRALPPGHSRLILSRFPSSSIGRQPPPYLVTSCASVCVRARVHGPTNLSSFFRRSAENWPNVHREGIQSGIKTPSDRAENFANPHSRTGHRVTLLFRIS